MKWLLLLLLAGCTTEPTHFSGNRMTIDYQVTVGDKRVDRALVESIISNVFSEVDTIYNNWNPDSEVSLFNRAPVGPFDLSPQLASLLAKVDTLFRTTGGLFDPTLTGNWNNLEICGTTATKLTPLTLDLCGISKGYCVDRLTEELTAAGYNNLFVIWGGEIRATGSSPQKRPWRAAIAGTQPLEVIDITNESVATSGDYHQNWVDNDGKLVTHIYNPKNGQPLELGAVTSTTIIAPTCWMADGLATALMIDPTLADRLDYPCYIY